MRTVLQKGYFDLIGRKADIDAAAASRPSFLIGLKCTTSFCKVNLLANTACIVLFMVGLLRASLERVNSGMIIVASLYFIFALVTIGYNFLAFFGFKSRAKKWWVAYRSVFCVQIAMAYIAFWINMTQVCV
jgi:hypothetical protein